MIFGNKQEIEKLKLQVALLSAKQTVMELETRLREKEEPMDKSIRIRKDAQYLIVSEAVCWLRDNLEEKRNRGVLSWQILRDFETHMISYIEDLNRPKKRYEQNI